MSAQFIFILQIFVSSLLVFFTTALLVEGVLWILRIKNFRLRAIFRLFPLLKLPVDLFLYKFSPQDSWMNLNPFGCAAYLKQLLPDSLQGPAPLTSLLWIVVISGIILSYKLTQIGYSQKILKRILRSKELCGKSISHPPLKAKLQQMKVGIFTSTQINTPFAVNKHFILLPQTLVSQLSQEEFEAVVAHELEHLRWRDPLFKLTTALISAFFWWIPMNWWLKKLSEEQELACDASIPAYGLDNHALATAFFKAINNLKKEEHELIALCQFAAQNTPHLKRLHSMLDEENKISKPYVCATPILATTISAIAMIIFRIC